MATHSVPIFLFATACCGIELMATGASRRFSVRWTAWLNSNLFCWRTLLATKVTTSMVDFLHNSARFFAHESCGQCTPCREGTSWALKMLTRIKANQGRIVDLDLLLEIGDKIGIMPGTTICGLADGAAWPLKNAIRKFRDEFEEYIRQSNPEGYAATEPVLALV